MKDRNVQKRLLVVVKRGAANVEELAEGLENGKLKQLTNKKWIMGLEMRFKLQLGYIHRIHEWRRRGKQLVHGFHLK